MLGISILMSVFPGMARKTVTTGRRGTALCPLNLPLFCPPFGTPREPHSLFEAKVISMLKGHLSPSTPDVRSYSLYRDEPLPQDRVKTDRPVKRASFQGQGEEG